MMIGVRYADLSFIYTKIHSINTYTFAAFEKYFIYLKKIVFINDADIIAEHYN